MITFDHDTSACYEDGRLVELSRIERHIVGVLSNAPGAVTTQALMLAVWGRDDMDGGSVTLAIQRVRRKFNADVISSRWRQGYTWNERREQ